MRAFGESGSCLTLAPLELPNVQPGRIHEIELASCLLAGLDDCQQRAAVFFGETKQQIATPANVFQPGWIQVDGFFVLLELTGQRLDRVVRGIVRLLEPAERRIDSLDRGQRTS